MKQLHVTLLNLKVVTMYAKELVETLAQKPNRIIFSGKPATLTPESEILKSSKPLPATKTVVVAASLCDALSQDHPVGRVSGRVATDRQSYVSGFSSLP